MDPPRMQNERKTKGELAKDGESGDGETGMEELGRCSGGGAVEGGVAARHRSPMQHMERREPVSRK